MNDGNFEARALWIDKPGECDIRQTTLPPLGPGQVRVKTLFSGISRGTERVIYSGSVPLRDRASMRAPFQEGDLPGPLKYGYCNVGQVEAGEPSLAGKNVFCLYPHQSRYIVPREAIVPLPANLPPKRALLAANMETAVNAFWDSGMTLGMRTVVIGAGVIGLLVAYLAKGLPGATVSIVEKNPSRWPICKALGLDRVDRPSYTPDIIFDASASADGLQLAIDIAGQESRVVVLSWFGDKPVSLNLGGAFHAKRLSIASSQVGHIAPIQRPRWSHRHRLSLAVSLLADNKLDQLVSGETAFSNMADDYEQILLRADDTLCHAINYSSET